MTTTRAGCASMTYAGQLRATATVFALRRYRSGARRTDSAIVVTRQVSVPRHPTELKASAFRIDAHGSGTLPPGTVLGPGLGDGDEIQVIPTTASLPFYGSARHL